MFITASQIRAARALLDWKQETLADKVGISKHTISKIENGDTQGSIQTLKKIARVLEDSGVEFIENEGVRKRVTQIYTLTGRENLLHFFDSMYEEVKESKELYACNVDEKLFDEWLGEVSDDHTRRMENIEDLICLTLVEEGKDYFPCESYTEYRWAKKAHFDSSPFYVFGDKVAILLFEEDVTIIVIHHSDVARAYKKQFYVAWENAIILDKKQK